MFGFKLQKFMLKDRFIKQCYGGVIGLEKVPTKKIPNKTVYIVNRDPSYKKEQHWVVLWYNETPEYFDSLGQFPPCSIKERLSLNASAF